MEFIFQLWFYSIGLVLMRCRYSKVYSNMQKIGYYNVDKDDKVCWLPSLLTTTCNYKYTHTHTNKDRHTQATNIEMRQWKRRRCRYWSVFLAVQQVDDHLLCRHKQQETRPTNINVVISIITAVYIII